MLGSYAYLDHQIIIQFQTILKSIKNVIDPLIHNDNELIITDAGDTELLCDAVPPATAERDEYKGERAEGGLLDHQQHHGGQPPADPGMHGHL